MTRCHCQLLKSPLPSPSQPPLAPTARTEDGLPLASLWPSPTVSKLPRRLGTWGWTAIWDRENLRQGGRMPRDEVAKHFSGFTLRENWDAE